MATSQSKGQIPFRVTGQTTCIHHKSRQLDLYCEICQEPACTKCLSTVHKSHTVCDLSEITPQKKEDIQNFVDNTENIDLVQINQLITSTDTQLKDNVSHFEKIQNQLKIQTNKLKEDLDLLTTQTLSLYQQMMEDNTKLLQTYKQDMEIYSTQLKQQVQECKRALQHGSDIQIYDTVCDIESSETLPLKPTLGTLVTSSFTPNKYPGGQLKQSLGEVYTSCQGQGHALQGHDLSFGASAGQGSSLTQQISAKIKEGSSPVYTLLAQTKVSERWQSPCYISSVCPTTDGQVWTSDFRSDTLTLLDRKGEVLQEVKHNTRISDISLSSTTNTLWVCDRKNNIAELMSGRLVLRFSTRETPLCICVTASNHVIVGMAKKISKFTTKGTLVLTTSPAGTGRSLMCTPYGISECPVTHNVAVADSKRDGGEGKPRVVVMDTYFKELFVYGCELPHTSQPTYKSVSKPFNPDGVVYDSVGNLVIGDRNNNGILLISGRGEFLRIIHEHVYSPWAVGIDREDVLWTVFGANNVEQLQYSTPKKCIIS